MLHVKYRSEILYVIVWVVEKKCTIQWCHAKWNSILLRCSLCFITWLQGKNVWIRGL